ncbi:MAG: hypothetical protein ACAI34_01320, partial [Verrucomicrobium sp.]
MNADTPASAATGSPVPDPHAAHSSQNRPNLFLYFLGALVLIACGVYFGMAPRLAQRAHVAEQTKELSVPTFDTVNPGPGKVPDSLIL